MRLVYVFDVRISDPKDYIIRVPEFIAKMIIARRGWWDFAPTPAGL